MRSYGQYCAAARALDVIGDRWALLIVRELLLRDCRFTDLRHGLPGVATNLLTERLRDLEAAGVLERVQAPPPVATTLYRLTERGAELEPVLRELTRWGLPEMVRGAGEDATRGHWVAAVLPLLYDGAALDGVGPLVVAVDAEGEQLTLVLDADGGLSVTPGAPSRPDVTLAGATEQVMAVLAGRADRLERLAVEGDERRLRELVGRVAVALPAA
jgi:DNA-binding HxlR family transcriptional regulator